jgi:hypothetical protein
MSRSRSYFDIEPRVWAWYLKPKPWYPEMNQFASGTLYHVVQENKNADIYGVRLYVVLRYLSRVSVRQIVYLL